MQIYLFTGGLQSDELIALEARLTSKFPGLHILVKLDELMQRGAKQTPVGASDKVFVIFPILAESASLEGLIGAAEQEHPGIFFIFVSKEISASDYKRLVRHHVADWVSLQGAPEEIEEIISREGQTETTGGAPGAKPIIIAFVPSGGGVGNSTLALEAAVQLKQTKQSRDRRICLLDLDLQTSHVCDYLDIEPRLQMRDIVNDPARLDAQLFELFVSHHSSGVDVIASPRSRQDPLELNLGALEALFGMIAPRYDILIVDLPPQWCHWTPQIVSVCDGVVISGLNTVPGLRQVAGTLEAVRTVVVDQITVVLNRCEGRLLGGVVRGQHIKRILSLETVITVRDDVAAAVESVNTGIPISLASPSSKIAKDIRPLAAMLAAITARTER